ncbi:MAG: DUF3095 domain-containing protein [Patescibacteria group bacterium]
MPNRFFYSQLAEIGSISEGLDPYKYLPVPRDWFVLIIQAQNTIEATIAKKYHNINLLVTAAIVALKQLEPESEFPFLFQGDRAYILIPGHLHLPSRSTLAGIKNLAKIKFGIRIKLGSIPVQNIYNDNYKLGITKIKLSAAFSYSYLVGNGLSYALDLLKLHPHAYEIHEHEQPEYPNSPELDLSRLDSSWQHLNIPNRQSLSIIIRSKNKNPALASVIYKQILNRLEGIVEILDFWNKERNFLMPNLNRETLTTLATAKTVGELKFNQTWLIPIKQLKSIVKIPSFLPGKLNEDGNKNDHHFINVNFSDELRLVLNSTPLQKLKITNFLDQLFMLGKINYGLHASSNSLISSINFQDKGYQLHFVDGNHGGLSFADKQLQDQLIQEYSSSEESTPEELR